MKIRSTLTLIVAVVVLVCAGLYLKYQHSTAKTPEAQALSRLLEQTLPDVQGTPQSLTKWQGKPLIINFWATWCTPCVEEMPELETLTTKVAPVQIIGIGIDTPANISQFAEKWHITYPLYVAGTSYTDLLRQFGNQAGGLPFTVLVGLDGELKKVYLGRLNFDELRGDIAALKKS